MHEVSVDFQDHHDISLIDTTLENFDGSLDGIDDVLPGSQALKMFLVTEASRILALIYYNVFGYRSIENVFGSQAFKSFLFPVLGTGVKNTIKINSI